VWVIERDGSRGVFGLDAAAAAVAFRPDSVQALVLVRGGRLVRITSAGLDTFAETGGAEELNAVGLQVSADGTRAFIAYEQGRLGVVDEGSAEARLTACPCTPTGLIQTSRTSVYRLNELPDSPLFLWDVAGDRPRTWFIPRTVQGEGQ
jgi:hypothetical protein